MVGKKLRCKIVWLSSGTQNVSGSAKKLGGQFLPLLISVLFLVTAHANEDMVGAFIPISIMILSSK
jgi:hypothetical protein